jgi:hypothetical protein
MQVPLRHIATKFTVVCFKVSIIFRRFCAMKMSGFNSYVLNVARALYVFVTVAAVCGALALLNIGGH